MDLRLLKICEECDDAITRIDEALEDVKAGLLTAEEAEQLVARFRPRVPELQARLDLIKAELGART